MSIIELSSIPTTRYQGSKRKILPWIHANIKDLKFSSALDVYGGTGVVSFLFKKMGVDVTYNDSLKFNHTIGTALIENHKARLTQQEIKNIFTKQKKINYHYYVKNDLGLGYFLDEENRLIDIAVQNINHMFCGQASDVRFKKSLALYSLFQSCLAKRPFNMFHRRNLNLRMANVDRTFGNKTTWDTPLEVHFAKFYNELEGKIFISKKRCKATNLLANKIIEPDVDLVYLDPPYISNNKTNETSNYIKCYHFLEYLSYYNNLDNMDFPVNRNNEVSNIYESFESLFYNFRKSIIVLSYKSRGTPSVDYFKKTLKKMGKKPTIATIPYQYALSKPDERSRSHEILLIAR